MRNMASTSSTTDEVPKKDPSKQILSSKTVEDYYKTNATCEANL
jgi:hypothetical protein